MSAEQLALESGSRIGEHTVLNKMTLPGGYGFWQDDMSELDRLNGELAQAREELERESELIRLHNELKEKQTVIEQRTLVYDTIAERTLKQSQMISQLARRHGCHPIRRSKKRLANASPCSALTSSVTPI